MPSPLVETILQYGAWSGPGYTAAGRARLWEEHGLCRILTPAERRIPGVDPYDNWVAKAHDLNEVDAESALRRRLTALGLCSERTRTAPGGLCGYDRRFEYSPHHRFVSLSAYRAAAAPAAQQDLSTAFLLYYEHLMRSNLQWCLDYVLNGAVKFRMNLQLLGGQHVFLAEAAMLEDRIEALRAAMGASVPGREGVARALDLSFLSPGGPDFAAPRKAFRPLLSRDAILRAPRRMLLRLAADHRDAENEPERAARAARRAQVARAAALIDRRAARQKAGEDPSPLWR